MSSVSSVSALMGLNERLPQSLTQISSLMRRTGARKPAEMSASARAWTRSAFLPEASPRVNRFHSKAKYSAAA